MKKLYILLILLTISFSGWSTTAPPKGYFEKVNELLEKQIAENNRLLEEGRSEEMNFVVDGYAIMQNETDLVIKSNSLTESVISKSKLEDFNALLRETKVSDTQVHPYVVLIPPFPQLIRGDIDISTLEDNDNSLSNESLEKLYNIKTNNTTIPISILTLSGILQMTSGNKVTVIPQNTISANIPLNNLLSQSKGIANFNLANRLNDMGLLVGTDANDNLESYYLTILSNYRSYLESTESSTSELRFDCLASLENEEGREKELAVLTEDKKEDGIQRIVDLLKNRIDNGDLNTKFAYIDIPKGNQGYIYSADQKKSIENILNEKLWVYQKEEHKSFYAINMTVDFYVSLSDRENFSKELLKKIKTDISNFNKDNTTIFLELYYGFKHEGILSTQNCLLPISLVLGHDSDGILRELPKQKLNSSKEFDLKFLDVYSQVLKKSIEYRYYLKFVDEPILATFTNERIKKRGKPYIIDLQIFYDKQTKDELERLKSTYTYLSMTGGVSAGASSSNYDQLQALIESKNQLIIASDQRLNSLNSNFEGIKETPSGWERHPCNLRERHIPKAHQAYVYNFFEQNSPASFVNEYLAMFDAVGETSEDNATIINSISVGLLYDFDKWKVLDDYVYGTLDVLSFIPLVESVADVAGFVYASARQDPLQAGAYAAGILVVGIPATSKGVRLALQKVGMNTVDVLKRSSRKIYYKGKMFAINSELYSIEFFNYLKKDLGLPNLPQTTPALVLASGGRNGLPDPWSKISSLSDQKEEIKSALLKMESEAQANSFIKKLKRGSMSPTLEDFKEVYQMSDNVFTSLKTKFNDDTKLKTHLEDLLVDASEGKTAVLALLGSVPTSKADDLVAKIKNLGDSKEQFLKSCNSSEELLSVFVRDYELVNSWSLVQESSYAIDVSFYNKLLILKNSSGKRLDEINDVIPIVRKHEKTGELLGVDDMEQFLKLADHEGLSNRSNLLLKQKADEFLRMSNKKRPTVVGVIEKDGVALIVGKSTKGLPSGQIYIDNIHPIVKEILQEIPTGLRSKGHGKCAEVEAISEFLHEKFKNKTTTIEEVKEALSGIKSKAIHVHKKEGSAGVLHRRYKCACMSCAVLLKKLNILEVSH